MGAGDSYAKLRGMQTAMPKGPRWYVISLRPRGMHAPLRRAARAAGHGFVALSPWRTLRCDDARDALTAAYAADIVVFTSPVAVDAARRLSPLPPSMRAIAVGAGTAAALRRAGVGQVAHPARMDSEGLLAMPEVADVAGRAIGLVTAPGGRDAIGPALAARGGRVLRADVYARIPCPPPPRALAQLRALDAPLALAVSSAEALRWLLDQVDAPIADRLRGARVVAASERVANVARACGCVDVVRAEGPRPAQLVAALDRPSG